MVTAQLCWSLCGRMCVSLCVCVKPACSTRVCLRVPKCGMCAPVCAHAVALHMGANDLVVIVHVWTCACDKCVVGEGLCNVNKQQQQQQQLRWLPLSLSYVVIRSGWKCGTTVPLTIPKHFSEAEDYRQKLNAVCSPLCVPHVTAPLATDPGPLLCHRPFGSAPQMCDMVTFNRSSDSPFVYTCMQACLLCNPIILQSVLPPTGWARYWQWHFTTVSNYIPSWETNKPK